MNFRADLFTQADPPNPEVKVLMVGSSHSTRTLGRLWAVGLGGPSLTEESRWWPLCCRVVGTGRAQNHPGLLLEAVSRAGHLKCLSSVQHLGERKANVMGGVCGGEMHV